MAGGISQEAYLSASGYEFCLIIPDRKASETFLTRVMQGEDVSEREQSDRRNKIGSQA